MIMLKVTKKQGLILSLKIHFLKTTAGIRRPPLALLGLLLLQNNIDKKKICEDLTSGVM